MDKDVVKNKCLPFDPPNSPGAVYQFLSNHPKTLGVKIEGAFSTPVLKVRTNEPGELSTKSRKAWSFYLFNMQERLAGAEHADKARQEIELLFKTDHLKLSVSKVLGVLQHLMAAEQAQLAGANSYVKRWLAHEKAVLQLAVPHDPSDENTVNEARDRAEFVTACKVLSKFSEGENGEIDTDKICDEAYRIGSGLTKEELSAIGLIQMKLNMMPAGLNKFIGPEARLLLNLCICANGKTGSEYRMEQGTKQLVSDIARVLQARTATDEYQVAPPPGTIAEGRPRRNSMPVFAAPETNATSSTSSSATTSPQLTPEKEKEEARTPANSPPSTPRRQLPDAGQSLQSTPVAATTGTRTCNKPGVSPLDMRAAIHELKNRQQTDAGNVTNGQFSRTPSDAPPAMPLSRLSTPGARASASSAIDSSTTSTEPLKTRSGRKRLEKEDRSERHGTRQKSDGRESSSHRTRKPESSRRARSMVYSQNEFSELSEAADRKALAEAGNAARALKADQIKPRTDSAIYQKWEAAEQQLKHALAPETSASIGRLISYCHEVNLEPGKERESLDKAIRCLRPQTRERKALIAVRDLLLAESRGAATTAASNSFPGLLSLLVFALEAEQAWRREDKAKSSH